MNPKTFRDIADEVAAARKIIGDLEDALRELRGRNDWEAGAERDERASVKLLYGELKARRASLAEFLDTRIVETAK
jgi:hypothetical protein